MEEQHASEVKKLEKKLDKVRVKLSDNSEEWRPRINAMTEIIEIINEGNRNIPSFDKSFGNGLWGIADVLVIQLGDLRSEITSTASQTICFLVDTFGLRFSRAAGKMMPAMITLSGQSNNLIRTHVRECVDDIFRKCQSKNMINAVIEELKSKSKNKKIQEACYEYLYMILDIWPMHKYKGLADALEHAILQGLKARTPETRETSAKCIGLYLGHFPSRKEQVYEALDTRARRLVDRIMDGDPDGEQYNRAGLSSRDGYYDSKDGGLTNHNPLENMSKLSLRPSSKRRNSSRINSLASPKQSGRRTVTRENSYSSGLTSPSSNSRDIGRRTPSGGRRSIAHAQQHRNGGDQLLEDSSLSNNPAKKLTRPVSTSSASLSSGRRSVRRAQSFSADQHHHHDATPPRVMSGRRRPRPSTMSSAMDSNSQDRPHEANMSVEEKRRLAELYNEHQNYLARSAVNLKDLHSQLMVGRVKSPLDTYLSMTIHHIETQLEMANNLKDMFAEFRSRRRLAPEPDTFLHEMDNFH